MVAEALAVAGPAGSADLLAAIYADVDENYCPWPGSRCWAHLRKLADEGRVRCSVPISDPGADPHGHGSGGPLSRTRETDAGRGRPGHRPGGHPAPGCRASGPLHPEASMTGATSSATTRASSSNTPGQLALAQGHRPTIVAARRHVRVQGDGPDQGHAQLVGQPPAATRAEQRRRSCRARR